MAKLNTSNPDHFIYENDMLQIEVLGGIKVEGLDRMRATLKAALKDSPHPLILTIISYLWTVQTNLKPKKTCR